jgi:hypothetical protein
MAKKEKSIYVKSMFVALNVLVLMVLLYLFLTGRLRIELFMALAFLQVIGASFMSYLYYRHTKMKKLAKELGFEFITRFLEQPRMEGMHKGNWFQLHFTSRDYGEYWGEPRTYVKLQYKEPKEFNQATLERYKNHSYDSMKIDSIEHMKRSYKNYLLMRVKYYVTDSKKLLALMDLLVKISKESEAKRKQ